MALHSAIYLPESWINIAPGWIEQSFQNYDRAKDIGLVYIKLCIWSEILRMDNVRIYRTNFLLTNTRNASIP